MDNQILYKIYVLYSTKDNQIRYVGYTKHSLRERLRLHIKDSKLCRSHKEKWLKRHITDGYKIRIRTIDVTNEYEEALRKEILYIKFYKIAGFNLVNGTSGGEGSKGYTHSDKSKRKNSEAHSKKIYYFNFETGELIGSFPSLKIMMETLKLGKSMTRYVLMGVKRQHRGYTFSYTPECPPKRPDRRFNKKKEIYYDL